MSYAYTIDRIEVGPDFEKKLRTILSAKHAERRSAEQDYLEKSRLAPENPSPPARPAHVPVRYDAQIEGAVRACVAYLAAWPDSNVKAVKVQIGGNVAEPGDELVSVHLWSVP
jgi:hypothetical protein